MPGLSKIDASAIDLSTSVFTAPNQPYFFYHTANGAALTTGTEVPKFTVAVTANPAYSTTTGYYTAPVTGVYAFSWCYLMQNIANGTQIDDGWIYNGTFNFGGNRIAASSGSTVWADGGYYLSIKQSIIIRLNAGDYFAPRTQHGDTSWSFYSSSSWGHISGTLIG